VKRSSNAWGDSAYLVEEIISLSNFCHCQHVSTKDWENDFLIATQMTAASNNRFSAVDTRLRWQAINETSIPSVQADRRIVNARQNKTPPNGGVLLK
jgi:hypothetical protein